MGHKRKPGSWLFLAFVILVYGITTLAEPETVRRALTTFLMMLRNIAPVLILVFILMFLVERFLTPEKTMAWLGPESGLRGWLIAPMAGALSTGPIYTWYAVLAELRDKGMRTALVTALLYARAVKLPLLPLMVHYFGLRYTLLLYLLIVVFSILNGLAMERLMRAPNPE